MYILKIYYYWKGSASNSTTKFFSQFLFLWSKPMTLTRKEQMQITRLRISYSNAFASYQKTVSWILWILQNQQRRRIPTLLLYQIQIQRKISYDVQSLQINRIRRKNLQRNLRSRIKKFPKGDTTSFAPSIEV